jgi:plastocyanin
MKTSLRFKPVILSISAVILLGTIGLTIMNISAVYAQEQEVKEVQAGIGVANAAINLFSPQQVQIKTGQSITWYNPTPVPEPHTVTFVLNNNNNNKSYAADLIAPFTISSSTTNSTQIMPLIPNSNSEPLMTPDNNAIIAINKIAYNPVVVIEDSTTTGGKNVTYMKQNANYSMSGTEDYINSGWLLQKGQENVYPGSGNTFTMTFQKAGTYDYLCIIHPYMTGRVIVK